MITGGQAGGGPVTVTLTVGSDPPAQVTPPPTTVAPLTPASPPTTVTVAHPHGPLPFTGAQVPIELGASALCVLAGLLLATASRRRARGPAPTL